MWLTVGLIESNWLIETHPSLFLFLIAFQESIYFVLLFFYSFQKSICQNLGAPKTL